MPVAYNLAVSKPKRPPVQFFAPPRVGVCGAQHSFSDAAAQDYAARFLRNLQPKYQFLISADAVLEQLLAKQLDFGVFPISNTYAGEVSEARDAMSQFNYGERFYTAREFDMVIRHSIIVRRGITKSDVRCIASHPHALAQCDRYIQKHMPGIGRIEYADTALAVAHLAADQLPPTTAVIASAKAGIEHQLHILDGNVQDAGNDNKTTFRVACRRD